MGGTNLVIKPKGQGFYAYKLECEDFQICFIKESIKNTPPIYVRFISQYLWKYGYQMAYEIFAEWFYNVFKTRIYATVVSRLDICCDIDEITFYPEDCTKFVGRAKKKEIYNVDSSHFWGKEFSGFVIGKGSPLLCRIYNKSLESQKAKKWFEYIWGKNSWNGQTVWRIEFQARRKVLKELQINEVIDIKTNVKAIWEYYTQKWITLRKEIDDRNISRWPIDSRWEKIQHMCGDYSTEPIAREIIKKGDLDTLLNSCIGYMSSIAALKQLENTTDTLKYLEACTLEKEEKKHITFKEEVERKKNRYL
ncbi:MAG: replication initiation factor [Clostridia bacterium]